MTDQAARSIINHADLLGIDMIKLEAERFTSWEHMKLVRVHEARVKAFEKMIRWANLSSIPKKRAIKKVIRSMPTVQCARCGFEWEINTIRSPKALCQSCRARKVQTVHSKGGKCIPWHGHFAKDEVTPVDDDGKPVLPGVRKCGHTDCVRPDHIEGETK